MTCYNPPYDWVVCNPGQILYPKQPGLFIAHVLNLQIKIVNQRSCRSER